MRIPVLFLIPGVIVVVLLPACNIFPENMKECDSLQVDYLLSSSETADKYLITTDGKVVFSINKPEYYSLREFKDAKISDLLPGNENVFNPFQIEEEISALQDFEGDEEFIPLYGPLRDILAGQTIKNVFNLPSDNRLVIEMKDEKALLLYDPVIREIKTILTGYGKINGLTANDKCIIISYDNNLNLYDLNSGELYPLADQMQGEKLNPFLSGNKLYFVNNDFSEFYSVYSMDINSSSGISPVEIYKTPNDIRMPKVKGAFLWYIEIIKSEYLLRRTNLSSGITESLTQKGVVYNYDFFNDTLISFIYSDLNTPKSLFLYNTKKDEFVNISGSAIKHNINASFISDPGSLSGAWLLSDTLKPVRGIILFIHPGLHSDFSPRWDNLLMNLCANGYYILAPNYPMSCGYGKTFTAMIEDDAVRSLIKWKGYILEKYKEQPAFCISASSGNLLMEELLAEDFHGISAAVSLFGIPGNEYDFKNKVPSLYILGENDPVVNFTTRYAQLNALNGKNDIEIISYQDEGHWFRKRKNMQDAVNKIISYFCLY